MPGVYTLEWRDGRKQKFYGHRGYYYVFPNQILLSFLPSSAWCHKCKKITLCERLEQPETIRAELEELDDPKSTRSQQISKSRASNFPEHWRNKRELQLRHVTARKLPPSCLVCGSRQVSFFPDGEWAPHPETGEEVRLSCTGMCSTGFAMKFYDTEGQLLDLGNEERERFLKLINSGKDL